MIRRLPIGVIGHRCSTCSHLYPVGQVHECTIRGVASEADAPKDQAA